MACTGEVTSEEVSNEKTIENLLEISGLSEKSEIDKILDKPTTGAFSGWAAWIFNLWMYSFFVGGAAENKTIGEYFSKFFSAYLGEEGCLPIVVALIIIGLIVFWKNKFSKSQDEQLMLKTKDRLVECFRENRYTSEQIKVELDKLIDEAVRSDEYNQQMTIFSKNDIDEWNKFLATKPSDDKRKKNLNSMFKKKIGKSYDDLLWQIVNEKMEQKLRAERILSNFRKEIAKKKAG